MVGLHVAVVEACRAVASKLGEASTARAVAGLGDFKAIASPLLNDVVRATFMSVLFR